MKRPRLTMRWRKAEPVLEPQPLILDLGDDVTAQRGGEIVDALVETFDLDDSDDLRMALSQAFVRGYEFGIADVTAAEVAAGLPVYVNFTSQAG